MQGRTFRAITEGYRWGSDGVVVTNRVDVFFGALLYIAEVFWSYSVQVILFKGSHVQRSITLRVNRESTQNAFILPGNHVFLNGRPQ